MRIPTVAVAGLLASLIASAEDSDIRLVLQVTVDGMRADRIALGWPAFGEGGLRTLVAEGAVYSNAHYWHANTETIVGHATLATGAHPSVHGMTGNVWYDSVADELSYNIEDPDSLPLPTRDTTSKGEQVDPAQLLARTSGRSPRAMLAETLADRFVSESDGQSKVFAVSNKDRSAVAMGGSGGKAFWLSTDSGDFGTTTYYYDEYPDWVTTWNRERKADRYADTDWSLLDADDTYRFIDQDDRPYETDLGGFGRTFPHRYGDLDNRLLFTQLIASPGGDALLADFTRALVDAEDIGQDDIVDYLSVSFSGVDAVNHFFGASSLESEDMIRRLDRTLAELLAFIDAAIGLDHVLVVLSADHGSAEAPEYLQSRGIDAGRLYSDMIVDAANQLGEELYNLEDVVKFYYRPYIYLRQDLIDDADLDLVDVRETIAARLVNTAGIHVAATTSNIVDLQDQDLVDRITNNYYANRAGDIYIVQDENWFNFDRGPVAVMHGSPWKYDTHVPLIFMGPGVAPANHSRAVQIVDVAPSIAAILGIDPPSSTQGSALSELVP